MNRRTMDPFGTSVELYDCSVTDINYVIDRPPNSAWQISNFVNEQSHIVAYAVSGRAHYEIDGEAYHIRPGALILMAKGTEHTATSDKHDPWHFMSAAFKLEVPGGDPGVMLRNLPSVSEGLPGDVAGLFRQMYGAWNTKQPGFLLNIRGLLSTVLHRIIQQHNLPTMAAPHVRRITAITQLLLDNYDRTYSVDELAGLSGLSSSHFRALFKRVTGMTATTYQQHVKITKATEFLSSGEYNVTETARLTGFRDVYYFSRLYKQVTGHSPSKLSKR